MACTLAESPRATLCIESSDSFVASAAVSIATGWSEPVPGRELHPLKSSAFHGALSRQLQSFSYNSASTFSRMAGSDDACAAVNQTKEQ